jgi:hypothetical protein
LSPAAKNSAMRAMSAGCSHRPMHWPRAISARAASSTHRRICLSVITQPGISVLTRMLKGPRSRDKLRVSPCAAACTGRLLCLSFQPTEPQLTIDRRRPRACRRRPCARRKAGGAG